MEVNPTAKKILDIISNDLNAEDLKGLSKSDKKTLKKIETLMFSKFTNAYENREVILIGGRKLNLKNYFENVNELNNYKLASLEKSLNVIKNKNNFSIFPNDPSKSKITKVLNRIGIFNAAEKRHMELGKLYHKVNPTRMDLDKAIKRRDANAIFKMVEFADPNEYSELIKDARDALKDISRSSSFSGRKAMEKINTLSWKLSSAGLE